MKGKKKRKSQRSAVRNDSRSLKQNNEKRRASWRWALTRSGHKPHRQGLPCAPRMFGIVTAHVSIHKFQAIFSTELTAFKRLHHLFKKISINPLVSQLPNRKTAGRGKLRVSPNSLEVTNTLTPTLVPDSDSDNPRNSDEDEDGAFIIYNFLLLNNVSLSDATMRRQVKRIRRKSPVETPPTTPKPAANMKQKQTIRASHAGRGEFLFCLISYPK